MSVSFGPMELRICGIETVVVNADLRNWVFVKVSTDDGLVGWGEATLEWQTHGVVGAVKDLAPVLLGQSAMRIEHLWQRMYRDHFFRGGVVTMSALSGVDQALWDLKARALGVPCWQLLGGAVRDRLPMYDHLGGGAAEMVYDIADASAFAAAAQKSAADGFTALKILAVPMGGPLPSLADVRAATGVMAAVRLAIGDSVELMVDLHGRTSAAGALVYGRAFAEYDPWFFEEPCPPGNVAELAEVARALPFPVATGERLIGLREFEEHLLARSCAVLQPDVCHVGGPTGLRRIAAVAAAHNVALAPHNPLGPVATMVNQHLGFATSNFLIQEVMRSDVPWRDEVVPGQLAITDGYVGLPVESGWGVTVDESAAARHPYQPERQLMPTSVDGSVLDW